MTGAMKLYLIAVFIPAVLAMSCVTQAYKAEEAEKAVPAAGLSSAAVSSTAEKAPGPVVQPPPGNGLDSAGFRNIPADARNYLTALADAFKSKNRDFLVSQGEAQYEKEVRSRVDEETYLALLYRAGPYSADSEWKPAVPPRLEYSHIRAIEYTGWEEAGPMLDIKGRLYLNGGAVLPCRIILAWRLPEPKILGERP